MVRKWATHVNIGPLSPVECEVCPPDRSSEWRLARIAYFLLYRFQDIIRSEKQTTFLSLTLSVFQFRRWTTVLRRGLCTCSLIQQKIVIHWIVRNIGRMFSVNVHSTTESSLSSSIQWVHRSIPLYLVKEAENPNKKLIQVGTALVLFKKWIPFIRMSLS